MNCVVDLCVIQLSAVTVVVNIGISEFYVLGSVHRESMSIIVQQDATIYSFYYISADSSTCFG